MTTRDDRRGDALDLRQRAEALARERASQEAPAPAGPSPEELQRTLHELQVHQIELEMQNEELRRAQAETDAARDRYVDLYDRAPVGYCTLSQQGLILEANLTLAILLGLHRGALVQKPVSRFVLQDDQDIYYLFRKRLVETGEAQECELRLVRPEGGAFWAHLTGTTARSEDGAPLCRFILSDITRRKRAEEDLETERKRAEERRREGFDLLQKLSRLVPGVIYQYRLYPDGRSAFPYSSAGMYDIYEVTPEEVREDASVVFGRIHPEDRERVTQAIFESARTLKPFRSELRVILPGQGLRWRWSQAHAERTEDGGTLWHGIILDITDRKQAEAKVAESEGLLRDILESTLSGFWDWNLVDNTEYLSPTFKRMFGYEEHEMESSPEAWQRIIFPEDLAGVLAVFDRHVKSHGRVPFYNEIRYRHRDGSTVWVICAGRVIEWAQDGTPIRMAGCHVDITTRKRAEAELVASERRLRSLYEALPLGYHSLDAQGCVLDVNPRWLEMLGYTQDEVLGRSFGDFLVPGDVALFHERFPKFLAAGHVTDVEFSMRRKDGTVAVVSIDGRVARAGDGSVRQTHCVLRDVTDRKRLERERLDFEAAVRQQQKLEAIGTLASGVAHEINNPLNVIMNYGQLILDNPSDPSRVTDGAENIVKESERVAVIVSNLLGFARQEKESHSPARIADIVERTLSLTRAVLRRDQIDLRCDLPEDLPTVKCRSQQIQQVLMNLLTNARDALNQRYPKADSDKVIRIEASAFRKDGTRWVRLTVEDHGSGIPTDVGGRIFDPFFTTKARDKGTGLGLAISHGIVKEHQGELWFETEPGKGTRFHMDLRVDGD